MVNPSLQLPQLLSSLINAEFTIASSKDKDGKSCICVDCSGNSLSEREKKEWHRDHKVFRAVQHRKHFSYKLEDIKSLGNEVLDVSDICVYESRNTAVIYPKPRSKSQSIRKVAKKCLCCDYEMRKVGLFCSILCKLQWTADDKERFAEAAENELMGNNRNPEKENAGEFSETRELVNKKAKAAKNELMGNNRKPEEENAEESSETREVINKKAEAAKNELMGNNRKPEKENAGESPETRELVDKKAEAAKNELKGENRKPEEEYAGESSKTRELVDKKAEAAKNELKGENRKPEEEYAGESPETRELVDKKAEAAKNELKGENRKPEEEYAGESSKTRELVDKKAKAAKNELKGENRKPEEEYAGESSESRELVNKNAEEMAQVNSVEVVLTTSYRKRRKNGTPCKSPSS